MREGNVEVIREGVARYNERDVDGVLDLLHEDFLWDSAFVAVEGSTFEGQEAVREYFDEIDSAWEEFELRPRDFIEGEDLVILVADVYGKGRGSGATINTPIWGVFWLREGKMLRGHTYLNKDEALEAAGLSSASADS